jgi:hypothetical protein
VSLDRRQKLHECRSVGLTAWVSMDSDPGATFHTGIFADNENMRTDMTGHGGLDGPGRPALLILVSSYDWGAYGPLSVAMTVVNWTCEGSVLL